MFLTFAVFLYAQPLFYIKEALYDALIMRRDGVSEYFLPAGGHKQMKEAERGGERRGIGGKLSGLHR